MPSHKHSYTKSVSTSESYTGNRGKTVLIHAIELFFYMKTPEFRKYHPSFLTPSAEEFLDYIQSRYRKFIATSVTKHRPLRRQHDTASKSAAQLLKQFLGFIHPDAAASSFKSLLSCLFIVVESLCLYFYIKSYVSPSTDVCECGGVSEYTAPLLWLLEQKMPSCIEYKHDIFSKLQTFVMKIGRIEPCITTATSKSMLELQGNHFIHTFQKQVTPEFYKLYFVAPLSFLFSKNGVTCGRELYVDILAHAVSVVAEA